MDTHVLHDMIHVGHQVGCVYRFISKVEGYTYEIKQS